MTIAAPKRNASRAALAIALLAFALMFALRHGQATEFANYVYLADAWRHGRNWIAFPGDFIDAIPFHGHAYVVEAPLPALLLYPAVLVFGLAANQTLLANALGALAVFAAWRLARAAGVAAAQSTAATAFFFFGTSLFACATVGDVWFVAHVSGVAFSLLALGECFGRKRTWLVAVWAIAAMFSRYPLVAALPVYAALLIAADRRRAPRIAIEFAVPVVLALLVAAAYNSNRFGTFDDPSFALFRRIMDRASAGSDVAFRLASVPMQLHALFVAPLRLSAWFPFVAAPRFGFGIAFTSLPFLYAFAAGPSLRTIALWIAVVATAIPTLTYFDTGGVQFGARHALDFEPFLFALLTLAMARKPGRPVTVALVAFAAAGAYLALFWLLGPG